MFQPAPSEIKEYETLPLLTSDCFGNESMSSIQGELTPGFFHLEKFGKYRDGITGPLNTLSGLEAKVWKDMSSSC